MHATRPCQAQDKCATSPHCTISPKTLQALRDAAARAASAYTHDIATSFAIQQLLRLRLRLRVARAANATAPLVRLAGCAQAFAYLQERLDIRTRLQLSWTCHALYNAISPGTALSFSIPHILRNLGSTSSKLSDRRSGLLHLLGRLLSRTPGEGMALRIRDPLSDVLLDTLVAHLHSLKILDLTFSRPFKRRRRARLAPGTDFAIHIWGSADDQAYHSLCERLLELLSTRAAPKLLTLRLSTDFPRRRDTAGAFLAVPAQFLSGASHLRVLHLGGIALNNANTPTGSIGNLVTFEYTPPATINSLMYEEIWNILESMPKLETLALSLRAPPEWSPYSRGPPSPHSRLRSVAFDLNFETATALIETHATLHELVAFFRDATEAGAQGLSVAARLNTQSVYSFGGVSSGAAIEHLAIYSQVDVGHVCSQLHSSSIDMPNLYLDSGFLEGAGTLSHILELSVPLSYLRDGGAIQTACPSLQRLTLIIDCCAMCSGIAERPCCELSSWLPQHSKTCQSIWPYTIAWDLPSLRHVALVCPQDLQEKEGPTTLSPCGEGCTIERDLIAFVRAFSPSSPSSPRLRSLTLCGLRNVDANIGALHDMADEIVRAAPNGLQWNSRSADDRMRTWRTAGPVSFFDPGFEWPANGEMELFYPPKEW